MTTIQVESLPRTFARPYYVKVDGKELKTPTGRTKFFSAYANAYKAGEKHASLNRKNAEEPASSIKETPRANSHTVL